MEVTKEKMIIMWETFKNRVKKKQETMYKIGPQSDR